MKTLDISVGTQLPTLRFGPINRTTLALFAGASGDHMPLHIDIDAAKAAGFNDVFAHGMLSMAYLGRLLTSWLPQESIRQFSTRFTAVTPLFATGLCEGTVAAIDDECAHIEIKVTLDDGTVTLLGEAIIDVDAVIAAGRLE